MNPDKPSGRSQSGSADCICNTHYIDHFAHVVDANQMGAAHTRNEMLISFCFATKIAGLGHSMCGPPGSPHICMGRRPPRPCPPPGAFFGKKRRPLTSLRGPAPKQTATRATSLLYVSTAM